MGRADRVLDPAAGRGEFINAVPAPERWAVDLVAYEEGTFREGTRFINADIFEADLPRGALRRRSSSRTSSSTSRPRTPAPTSWSACTR